MTNTKDNKELVAIKFLIEDAIKALDEWSVYHDDVFSYQVMILKQTLNEVNLWE